MFGARFSNQIISRGETFFSFIPMSAMLNLRRYREFENVKSLLLVLSDRIRDDINFKLILKILRVYDITWKKQRLFCINLKHFFFDAIALSVDSEVSNKLTRNGENQCKSNFCLKRNWKLLNVYFYYLTTIGHNLL